MSDEEYYHFCIANADLRLERTAQGEILIAPPAGGESSYRNGELLRQIANWAKKDGRGRTFDSSAEFILPDRSALSPDASWVARSKLNALTPETRRKFLPLAPGFVVEVMSPSDWLSAAQAKMEAWMANGVELGWLIDADRRTVYVYRPGETAEAIVGVARLRGEGPVDGFVMDLADIWAAL